MNCPPYGASVSMVCRSCCVEIARHDHHAEVAQMPRLGIRTDQCRHFMAVMTQLRRHRAADVSRCPCHEHSHGRDHSKKAALPAAFATCYLLSAI
jgi:hypothetical protein